MDTTAAYAKGYEHGRKLARVLGYPVRKVIKFAVVGLVAKLTLDAVSELGPK